MCTHFLHKIISITSNMKFMLKSGLGLYFLYYLKYATICKIECTICLKR